MGSLVKTVINPSTGRPYYGTPHNWYGPGFCIHGQADPFFQATGPAAGSMAPIVWFWDPATLAAAAQGRTKPWNGSPVSTLDLAQTYGFDRVPRDYFGGAWFEPTSKLLFVTGCNADALTNP